MKISEKSWHLRFARRAYGRHYTPRDLCGYFWRLVLAAVLVGLWISLMVNAIYHLVRLAIKHPIEVLIGIALVGLILGVLLAAATAPEWVPALWSRVRRRMARPASAAPRIREPNPVVEYLKAKKRGVCPLIEVVD